MDKQQTFLKLAARLRSESLAAKWSALAVTDQQLAELLARLPGEPALNAAEQVAYLTLRGAHDAARTACALAQAQAHERVQALCQKRTGWDAYALSTNMQDAST